MCAIAFVKPLSTDFRYPDSSVVSIAYFRPDSRRIESFRAHFTAVSLDKYFKYEQFFKLRAQYAATFHGSGACKLQRP